MGKPFKSTGVGKFLTSKLIKGVLSKVPIVGGVASEMLNSTDTPEGTMNREKLVHHLIKMAIGIVLVYLVLSGKFSWADAEQAKDFITQ